MAEQYSESLTTYQHPSGTLTINNLELAGMVMHWLALEAKDIHLYHKHIRLFCNNASALAWVHCLCTSKSKVLHVGLTHLQDWSVKSNTMKHYRH